MTRPDSIDVMQPFRDVFREVVRRPGAKAHIRVDITPKEGPFIDVDEKRILAPIAEAVLAEIQGDLAKVTETVAPATIEFRRKAEKAGKSKRWWLKRYAGGRTGFMPPTGSVTAMLDSGRLAKTMVAAITGTKPVRASINVAANRLTPASFPGAHWPRFQAQVVRWVPALAPGVAFERVGVQHAVAGVLAGSLAHTSAEIDRQRAQAKAKATQLAQMRLALLGKIL